MNINRHYYKLVPVETMIHKILNDSSVSLTELSVEDIVHELMRVNRAIDLMREQDYEVDSFFQGLYDYKHNILKFLESVK
jgi:hypothetical protein